MAETPFGQRADPQRTNRWWTAPKKDDKKDPLGGAVAQWITRVATKLETAQVQRRWRSLVFYRHFTGRPQVAQFAYGMAKRPTAMASYYSGFNFSPPTYNLIAICANVYVNRLFQQRMFMSVLPERGQFEQRQQSEMIQMWVEAGLHSIGLWDQLAKFGIDGLCYGSGIFKVAETMRKEPGCFRVHPDELLYENEDDDNPSTVIQRVWASREDVMDRYGVDAASRDAIAKAQSAYPAFWFSDGLLDCGDVIPLLEGWRVQRVDGKPGRHVLAVSNCAITDEKYEERDLPFEKWDFRQLPSGVFGQGLAEILLRINEEIDRLLSADTENAMRGAWPKVLTPSGANVNPAALGDTSMAMVKYDGPMAPEFVMPPTMGAENEARVERLVRFGKETAHVSEQAVKADSGGGANASAVALEKRLQIDDASYAEMGGRLEKAVEGIAYKLIKLGKKLKPSFTLPGRNRQLIKWDSVKLLDSKTPGLQAIGMSRFPQTIGGRQEILDAMLANGAISRQLHTRFSQVPDIDGLQDELNAPCDSVDKMLSNILSSGEYEPPMPFMDLPYAKTAVEARYMLEYAMGTPRESLDDLLAWRASVMELIAQASEPDDTTIVAPPGVTPPGAAPTEGGGFGDQQSGNTPLAPSPPQIAPALPPPT